MVIFNIFKIFLIKVKGGCGGLCGRYGRGEGRARREGGAGMGGGGIMFAF